MNWQIFGIIGWVCVLLGWLLQRPSVQKKLSNVILQIGSGNQSSVVQTQTNKTDSSPIKADSPLAKASSWATIAGLAATIYPLLAPLVK
jgi:hypothetical protein